MTGQCGQPGGYVAHLRRGEQACEPCKAERRDYMREWRRRSGRTRHPELLALAAVREVVRQARQISPSERAVMYVADVELALGTPTTRRSRSKPPSRRLGDVK